MSNAALDRYQGDDENEERPEGAIVRRDGFGSREMVAQVETASSAMAAQATAMAQARFIVAAQRPRSMDDVRTTLLRECRRPAFAHVARYRKPQGKKQDENGRWVQNYVEGPSIRFVEAVLRLMGNCDVSATTTYDDAAKRIVAIQCIDFETGASWSTQITVEKTIERRDLKKNQRPIATRTNSYGEAVYILPATDDDVANKVAAAVSKAARTVGLRLVPGDLKDECMALVRKTSEDEDAKDPDAARKGLVDGFAALGVRATDLADYLGHTLAGASPSELTELRAIYVAIRDEGVRWGDVLATKAPAEETKKTNPNAEAARKAIAAKTEKLKSAAKAPMKGQAPAAAAPAAPPSDPGEAPPDDEPQGRQPGDD